LIVTPLIVKAPVQPLIEKHCTGVFLMLRPLMDEVPVRLCA
jgi:hypothetical protein